LCDIYAGQQGKVPKKHRLFPTEIPYRAADFSKKAPNMMTI